MSQHNDTPEPPNPTQIPNARLTIEIDHVTGQVRVDGLNLGPVMVLGLIEFGKAIALAHFHRTLIAPAMAAQAPRILTPHRM